MNKENRDCMNYDVFISSKSEDYHLAEEVYNFLKTNGLSVFIASEELKKIGEAQYANAIDEVLDDSKHMIVVASSVYNIKSKWVKYEWSTFSNDLKSGYRDGNLLTILSGNIELRTLPASLRHQQSFNFRSYKDEILDYLNIDKRCEQHNIVKQNTSANIAVFKFYSNENCQIMLEGKLIANIIGMSDEPYCIPISRKGDYRFKCINSITAETQILKEHIGADEEKDIDIHWEEHKPFVPDQEWPEAKKISGDTFIVELGNIQFEMLRVDGGTLEIGATKEQGVDAENNEYPAHKISLPTFYMGRFPITQNIWETVMGYNKSHYKYKEDAFVDNKDLTNTIISTTVGTILGGSIGAVMGFGSAKGWFSDNKNEANGVISDKGHYPAENLTYDEAYEFVRRLSKMTNIQFDLPTEKEWEYAARGGQKSNHYRYAGNNNIDDIAWYRNNSERSTHPVGEKQPNELGLYDMCGNVWEWTKTPAHSYATNIEPKGNIFIRRGGSWWHEDKNCRVSRRYASDHTKKTSGLGLRVVIRKNVE